MTPDVRAEQERRCPACDSSLHSRSPQARFCGASCRQWWHRHRAPRPSVTPCRGCGLPFSPTRHSHVCCSGRCRQRVHRSRQRTLSLTRSERLAQRWGLETRDFWRTPPWLFRQLDREFHFGLDAAAAGRDDALCERFLTPDIDGLTAPWWFHCDPERPAAFVNPPYSRKGGRGQGLLRWAGAAVRARGEGLTVAMLVPPSPGTRYHRLLHKEAVELRMPDRRLAFLHPDTGEPTAGNRGDSMVAILRPGQSGPAAVSYITRQPDE